MPRIPRGFHQPAGSNPARMQPSRRTGVTPIEQFTGKVTTPINTGAANAVANANGSATVQVGPQALGTVWRVQQITGSTTSGAQDYQSSVQVFGGQGSVPNLLIGSVPVGAGGQWVLGQANITLTPGASIVAIWANAVAGDVCSLVVYGEQDAAYSY